MIIGPPTDMAALECRRQRLGWLREWDRMLLAGAVMWGTIYYLLRFFFRGRCSGLLPPDALSDVPVLLAATLVLLRAAALTKCAPTARLAWQALAAAQVCYAVGDVLYFWYESVLGERAFPSWADLFFGGYYVFCVAGLALFYEPILSPLERLKLRLDYATILVGSSAILWYSLLRPIAVGRGVLEASLSVAYPAGDLALVFVAIAPLAERLRIRRDGHVLLLLAFLIQFGADTAYASRQLTGTYSSTHWTDCLWAVSTVCVMAAALRQRRADEGEADRSAFGSPRIFGLLPYVAIATVSGLLLYVSREHWWQPLGGAVFAALGVTALVVARQVLASRENARLLTERAALVSEARFRSLVQNASDVISILGKDDRCLYLSPSAERILGYAEPALRGTPLTDLVHTEDVPTAQAFLRALRDSPGHTHSTVLRARHQSGRWLYVEAVGTNLSADPTVAGLVVTLRDVTERKDLREAKAAAESASRAKSQFLANMSHEIRTPLNGVLGVTELLMESGLTPGQRRLAELARSSGESLVSIVDDILDFSRIEAGRLELEEVAFDPREIVEGVIALLAERARAKDVELGAVIASDVPHIVRGDPGRLRQVLLNLVGNAVKFTPRGEILVRVGLLDEVGPSPRLAFEVRDTGIGIAPASLSRIFDAFAQADSSTTRRYGGAGLGLAISRQLVDLMGGTIEAESALGVGTTFRFTARFGGPVAPAAEAASVPVLGRLAVTANQSPGAREKDVRAGKVLEGRVLLVEDSAVNRTVAEGMLDLLGCRVELAADGSEALAALSQARYDVVLMDCMMPGVDGYQATEELRRREALEGRRTPVVALTANAMSGDRERCLAVGMDDYLSKPFRQEELRTVLARWLPRVGERRAC